MGRQAVQLHTGYDMPLGFPTPQQASLRPRFLSIFPLLRMPRTRTTLHWLSALLICCVPTRNSSPVSVLVKTMVWCMQQCLPHQHKEQSKKRTRPSKLWEVSSWFDSLSPHPLTETPCPKLLLML